ncbi:MAG: hypothetical protein JO022_14240, partial [Acidobacteriaceae bacterium]|nr:hypothetical protein [Acidobacteriaceae bacterium]
MAEPDGVHLLDSQPLHFEPASSPDHFVARGAGYQLDFAGSSAVLQRGSHRMRLDFAGSSKSARLTALEKMRATSTIIRGNDRNNWRSFVPTYQRLAISNLYPGVDLTYYGQGGQLEYDLTLKPGVDPGRIRLKFSGDGARLDRDGVLSGAFIQKVPVAYQIAGNGSRVPVNSRYRKNADGTFGFELGAYDRRRELVIDPVLSFSAWVAGSGQESARAIGHDAKGLIYVAGNTTSTDLPLVGDTFQASLTGTTNVFIAVMDPTASPSNQLVYLTYFGGSQADTVNAMKVTPSGTVYLVGNTTSPDLPLNNAAQSTLAGGVDAFVVKFIPAQGSSGFYYGSYYGGTSDESGNGITVDGQEKIYITGSTKSGDLPISGAIESSLGGFEDAFVAILDPAGSGNYTLAYATYFGGSGTDVGRDVAAAADGTIWFVGSTYSSDFPVAGNSYNPQYAPGGDA